MVWLSLILPTLAALVMLRFFKKKITWYEPSIPVAVCVLLVVLMNGCSKKMLVSDIEYWGGYATEARYYEAYSTWVSQMCTREVPCGTDKDGNTVYCTEYYDCSYCDYNSAYWMLIDNLGDEYNITKEKYNELVQKWKMKPLFNELNRSISYHGSCGSDGNMYSIRWNNEIMTSEATTSEHNYTNKVQASHSAFKLPYISNAQARKEGLYRYPKLKQYDQEAILGIDSISGLNSMQIDSAKKYFKYFNGFYGHSVKVKVFVLLFFDKPYEISHRQEAYWDGGNKNEIVVCIGLNRKTNAITWVYPFSWTNEKRVTVNCREDIAVLKTFDWKQIFAVLVKDVPAGFKYRDFSEFNYLDPDLRTGQVFLIWIIVLLTTVAVSCWAVSNDLINKNDHETTYN